MNTFECIVGVLGPNVPVPPFLTEGGTRIRDAFRIGSGGRIDLRIDTSQLRQPMDFVRTDGTVAAFDLHRAVRRPTRNPTNAKSVDRIALLLGDRYGAPGVLGAMFDTGPAQPDGIAGPPREACAVFLGEIAAFRDGLDRALEEIFTSIHEIGHVFNLYHIQSDDNFMRQSQGRRAFKETAYHFDNDHMRLLSADPLPLTTWPGGSNFDGDNHNMEIDLSPRQRQVPVGIRFRVQTSRSEFFYFEPVEVDLNITIAPDVARPPSLPNEVDPGYQRMRIWIESPTGERRAYAPLTRFCTNLRRQRISRKAPFRRDLHLTFDRDGAVFRTTGIHTVQAEIDLGRRGLLRSNRVEIMLRPLRKANRADGDLARLMVSDPERILVMHKLDRAGGDSVSKIDDFVNTYPQQPASAHLRYCAACAVLELASWTADSQTIHNRTSQAVERLREVAQDDRLGAHRQRRCAEIVEDHGPGRRRSSPLPVKPPGPARGSSTCGARRRPGRGSARPR